MKKLTSILLGIIIVLLIRGVFFIQNKNTTIAQLEDQTKTQNLIKSIIETQNKIISLREHKFELCDELGQDIPYKLIGVCPEPKSD